MSAEREHGARLSPDEHEELSWLRRENTLLRVENDMLRRIATEYALDRSTLAGGRSPSG